MMSPEEKFRVRIRNWVRVYRDRPQVGESNLMPILRELRLQRGIPEDEQKKRSYVAPQDERDADLLDQAFKRLVMADQYILMQYWLVRKSDRAIARSMGVYWRQCRRWLFEAERHFLHCVEKLEKDGYNDGRKIRRCR